MRSGIAEVLRVKTRNIMGERPQWRQDQPRRLRDESEWIHPDSVERISPAKQFREIVVDLGYAYIHAELDRMPPIAEAHRLRQHQLVFIGGARQDAGAANSVNHILD